MTTASGNPDEPIEDNHRALMNALAHALREVLAPYGFALLVFDFNRIEGGRMNYISNANREDMMKALREFVDEPKNHPGLSTP
ncbi:hypothetical protein [Paraburkholderia sp. MM6662-R1]|uniref:hypothetical protein n=1 Tax=Paraburkholderia sp. MM6662-R1 TaxID=2991066 RepID=UPI003D2325B9